MDHDQCKHCLTDFGQVFVIFGQAAPLPEPTKCVLNHLPARQQDETFDFCSSADQDQREAEQEPCEQGGNMFTDTVGQHGPELEVKRLNAREQLAYAIRVLNGCGLHEHAEQQPVRAHCNVSLGALNFFGCIITARSALFAILMLWVSMTAAVGLGLQPCVSRSIRSRPSTWRKLGCNGV